MIAFCDANIQYIRYIFYTELVNIVEENILQLKCLQGHTSHNLKLCLTCYLHISRYIRVVLNVCSLFMETAGQVLNDFRFVYTCKTF